MPVIQTQSAANNRCLFTSIYHIPSNIFWTLGSGGYIWAKHRRNNDKREVDLGQIGEDDPASRGREIRNSSLYSLAVGRMGI